MEEEVKEKNHVFYGVYYCKNGEMVLIPGKDQQECIDKLKEKLKNSRFNENCKGTTIIKRDLNTLSNPEFIFGCPKSLNLKNEK